MKQKNNEVTFHILTNTQIIIYYLQSGHAVAHLVEILRYKPKGRGFHFFYFSMNIPSGRTMVLGSTNL